jgi:uncharacterized protein (UPF0335 family)
MAKKKEAPTTELANSQSGRDELRSFIERWESLEADKKAIAEDQKELMAEAKGRGYDTKIMRRVIAERKRDADDIAEEEAILDLYRAALGMGVHNDSDDEDDESGMV